MDRRTVTRLVAFAVGIAVAAGAMADTFNLFQPANGVLKGNTSTYVTTSAAASDVVTLFNSTSTCTSPTTEFLRADGICAVPAGSGSGSVTSVAISAPASIFSITGSPITGSGTLTLSYATGQTPTELFGTDGSGNVSLFALTGAYVPPINLASTSNGGITGTLGVAHGGTGAPTLTAHGVLVGEGTSAITGLTALAADNVLMGVASADPAGKAVPNCGSGTQALSYSTSTHTWGCQTISAGTGTVTSVALTAPSVFSVTGSPVSSTGTLALTFAGGQTANQFLRSPNGTAGAISLGSIVLPDLPPINLASSSNGGVAGNLGVSHLNNGTGASSSTCWFGDGTWKACGSGGGVTSVGLSLPSVFTVSGSPVTSSGTLSATFATGQSANRFLATPDGLTGALGLRSMVANDFSAISPINWTGLNTFNGANTTSTATSGVNLGQTSNRAIVTLVDTNGAADNHSWQFLTGSAGTNLSFRAIDDAQAIARTFLSVNRSGASITSIGIGNTTDKPSIALNGATTVGPPSSGTALSVQSVSGGTAISANGDLSLQQQSASTGSNIVLNGQTGGQNRLRYSSGGAASAFDIRDNDAGVDRITIGTTGAVSITASSTGSTLSLGSASTTSTAQSINGLTGGLASIQFAANNGSSVGFVGTAGAANQGQAGSATGDTFLRSNSGGILLGNGTSIFEQISSAGNTTFNAPSSGTTVQVNALSSVPGLQVSGSAGGGAPIETLFQNTNSAGYTSIRLFNDIGGTFRALELDYSGSAYSGSLVTGGAVGESASITTTGSFPLSIGAGNTERIRITPGTATVNVTGNLSVNNVAVCQSNGTNCPGGAIQLVAYGAVSSACAVSNNKNASCFSHPGTGIFNISVSGAGFSGTPLCTANTGVAFVQYAIGSSSSTIAQFATYNSSGTNADEGFTFICVQ